MKNFLHTTKCLPHAIIAGGDNIRKLFGASVNALAGSDTANTGAKKPSAKMTGHQNISTFGNGVTADGTH